jgi:hypothetical protein
MRAHSPPPQALQSVVGLRFLNPTHSSGCESECTVFSTGLFFTGQGCQPNPQPPTWRTSVPPFGTSLLTRPAWEAMPAAKLPSAQLMRPLDHTSPIANKAEPPGKIILKRILNRRLIICNQLNWFGIESNMVMHQLLEQQSD